MRYVLAAGCLLLAACDKISPPFTLESDARSRLSEVLSDPTSFYVQNVHEGFKPGSLCGQVNAKNLFGAYTGFHEFVIASDPKAIAVDSGSSVSGNLEDGAYFMMAAAYCNRELHDAMARQPDDNSSSPEDVTAADAADETSGNVAVANVAGPDNATNSASESDEEQRGAGNTAGADEWNRPPS